MLGFFMFPYSNQLTKETRRMEGLEWEGLEGKELGRESVKRQFMSNMRDI